MLGYIDRYSVVKMKIGASIKEDLERIEGLKGTSKRNKLAVDANGRFDLPRPSHMAKRWPRMTCFGTKNQATRWTTSYRQISAGNIKAALRLARTFSRSRMPETLFAMPV
jgi:hypothetical protein